jgi:hypothetical protein
MRTSRRLALAAAVTLIAAAIGVIDSGKASATTFYYLCNKNTSGVYHCAYAQGSGYVVAMDQPYAGETDMTRWYLNANGEIEQGNTDLCMEINHDGGNVIREATCENVSYQNWEQNPIPGGGYWFNSQWDPSGVIYDLTYNQTNEDLDVIPNSSSYLWYETFTLTTSLP